MEICDYNKCTGCSACVSSCSSNCITMQEDKYGELHPIVDEMRCVKCGLCIKTCPNNKSMEFNYPLSCYASWITDKKKRRKCASGGIGSILSEYAIENGGVVFGSRYNDELTPTITYTEDIDELEKFKGSRYVQSLLEKQTYKQLSLYLKKGRNVLFIGTPCQIAGIKNYLRKDYENLITVDLICHGSSPTKYFKDEIEHLKSERISDIISDIRFRGNDGNNYCFTIWGKRTFNNNLNNKTKKSAESEDILLYKKNVHSSHYLFGFLQGITLRENCYSCQFARPERVSDITIGDFIGLGEKIPFKYSTNNVSSVMLNTKKGAAFYSAVSKERSDLVNIERPYSERLRHKASLLRPCTKHKLTPEFRQAYLEGGYIYATRTILSKGMRNFLFVEIINRIKFTFFFPLIIARKIYKYLKA